MNKSTMVSVKLDEPIKRGETVIKEIRLRKPRAGELRGLSLVDVAHLEVTSLIRLLPRISDPALTEQEVANMDPSDMTALGVQVASFLPQKSMREGYQDQ